MSVEKIPLKHPKKTTSEKTHRPSAQTAPDVFKQLADWQLSEATIATLSAYSVLNHVKKHFTHERVLPLSVVMQLADYLLVYMQTNDLGLRDLVCLSPEAQTELGVLLLFREVKQMMGKLSTQDNGLAQDLVRRLDKEYSPLGEALGAMPSDATGFLTARCQGVMTCYDENTLNDIHFDATFRTSLQHPSPFFHPQAISLAKVICEALDRLWQRIFWQPRLDATEKTVIAIAEQGKQQAGVLSR